MWTLSQDITGLLVVTCHQNEIHIHKFTYLLNLLTSTEKHSDMDLLQTRDCLLLWTADMDLWLNSPDWCGSKSYNPHTSVDRTTRVWEQHCRSPLKLSGAAAAAIVSFNRENFEWAKYKNKQGGVWCDHWSLCCNVICVLNGAASPCRLLVAD